MIDTITKWKKTEQWTKEAGRYIPHPLTWLNRNGWLDETEVETEYQGYTANEWNIL